MKNIRYGAGLFLMTISVLACSAEPAREAGVTQLEGSSSGNETAGIGERPLARFTPALDLAQTAFGDIPFPNNAYITESGHLSLEAFPQRGLNPQVDSICSTLEDGTKGFATNGTFYITFDSDVDESLLPDTPADSLTDGSSLVLVDIDPNSPHRGERFPLVWQKYTDATTFIPAFTLAVRTYDGFPLRSKTQYALYVTTGAARASDTFRDILAEEPTEGIHAELWTIYAPLRAYTQETGVEIAVATIFTTQDVVGEMLAIRDHIHSRPAPTPRAIESQGVTNSLYEMVVGLYDAPNFQDGESPFLTGEGGKIYFDASGAPIVQHEEELRFALSVPVTDEMPEAGWPVVLYGHGTGGNYQTFSRSANVASRLAQQEVEGVAPIAVLSIDQLHHGQRDARENSCATQEQPLYCVALLFFNLLNFNAVRDNIRQSAADFVSLYRLAQNFEIRLPGNDGASERTIKLDPNRIMYFGHSQGGLNGPLFLAVERDILGAVFSATGGNFSIVVEKRTDPLSIAELFGRFFGLDISVKPDRWHPVFALIQTFIEPSDTINYARHWFREPFDGARPKSIFMTGGFRDLITPIETVNALVVAAGVPQMPTVFQPLEGLSLRDIAPLETRPPISANLDEGRAAAGFAQYERGDHFVMLQRGVQRYRQFIRSVMKGTPKLY